MAIKIQGTTVIDDSQNATFTGTLTLTSTGAVKIPAGTEAERPTGVAGMLRFNSDSTSFEGYDGSEWGAIGGAGGGASTTASNIETVKSLSTASHYLTFVNSNNESTQGEALFTTSTFNIIPETGLVSIDSTSAIKIPVGTESNKPTGASGMLRYNSELNSFEGHNGTIWSTLGNNIVNLDVLSTSDNETQYVTFSSLQGTTATFYTTSSFGITPSNGNILMNGVGAVKVPSGTTAQRPGPFYSVAFDGNGDYLLVPGAATNFITSTGDWTFEAWIYATSFTGPQSSCPIFNVGARTGDSLMLRALPTTNPTTTLNLYAINTANGTILGSTGINGGTVAINTWYHVAAVRQSGVFKVFLNGEQVIFNDTNTAAAIRTATADLTVGAASAGTNPFWNGYISNFRVINGTAAYTANFAPPENPLTVITNTVLLTAQDINVIDNSANGYNIIRFGQADSVTDSPFTYGLATGMLRYNTETDGYEAYDGSGWQNITSGTGALKLPAGTTVDRYQQVGSVNFDGVNPSGLSIPLNAAFAFGSNNFTIEAWVYARSFSTNPRIFTSEEVGLSPYFILYLNTSGILRFSRGGYGVPAVDNAATVSISLNSWNHLALVKSGGSIFFYINGVQSGSAADTTNYSFVPYNIGIGSDQNNDEGLFDGHISNLRVVNSTAVYTANFVPAKEPLQTIANTVLLTCQGPTIRDASTNNFSITAAGNTAPSSFSPFKISEFVATAGMIRFNTDLDKFEGYNGVSWSVIGATSDQALGAGQIETIESVSTTTHYVTFVDTNNTVTSAESVYTTSSLAIIPGTGDILMNGTGAVKIPVGTTAQRPSPEYSVEFSGANQNYLSIRNATTQFNFGTGNFTVEAWVYARSFANSPAIITNGEWSSTGWYLFFQTNGEVRWYGNFTTQVDRISTVTVPLNTWTHIAVVRSGGTLFMYANGQYIGGGADSLNYGASGVTPAIGSDRDGDELRFDGYISNVRVVNGTAVYTGNFTPPAAPLTAITNTALLTCQDLNFIDNSANNLNIVQIGTDVDTVTVSPFSTSLTTGMMRFNSSSTGIESYDGVRWQNITSGTGALQLPVGSTVDRTQTAGSVNFDGTGDVLLVPADPAFEFGTGAFTIEAWVYARNFSDSPSIFSCAPWNNAVEYHLIFNTTGTLRWRRSGYGSNLDESSTAGIITNAWQHVALVKSGNNIIFYINGVASGSFADSANNYAFLPFNTIAIGTDLSITTRRFNGYISNLRVVKGTAVYTANFTPVKEPLQAIANTVLLTCQGDTIRDASVNDFPITVAGDAAPDTFGPIKLDEFTSAKGMMRFNSDLNKFEGYDGSSWRVVGDTSDFSVIASTATSVQTLESFSTSTHYVTFVDSNNTTTTAESVYTTSSLAIIPSTGDILMNGTGAVKIPVGTTGQRPSPEYSVEFSGVSGNFLRVNHPASSSQFQFSTGAFTVEAWAYPRSFADNPIIISNIEIGASTNYWLMHLNTSGFLVWGSNYNSVTVSITANLNPLQLNTWSHVAVVHESATNATYLYVNGVQSGAIADSINYGVPSYLTSIGADQNGDERKFDGYISNVRVVKDAVYTANFTPPAAPLTAIANTVLLTCQDLNVVDNSTNNFNIIQFGTGVNTVTVTPFGTSLTTGMMRFNSSSTGIESYDGVRWQNITSGTGALQLPVGTTVNRTQTAGSVNFDSSGDGLSIPATSDFAFGTGAFTIEAWVYHRGFIGGESDILFGHNSFGSGARWEVLIGYSGAESVSQRLYWNSSGYTTNISIMATNRIEPNSWNHVAVTRSGSTLRIFLNGIQQASGTDSNDYTILLQQFMTVGAGTNFTSGAFNGYISNLRVVKGTAVYTANFTPVKEPLQAIANTVLLTCQGDTIRDASANDFPITVVGDAAPNVFGPIKLDEFISAKGMMRFNSDLNKFEGYDGLSWRVVGDVSDFMVITSTATSVQTLESFSTATHYVTFVDSNNTTTTAESVYTTSSLAIIPSTGDILMNGTGAVKIPVGTTGQRPSPEYSVEFSGASGNLLRVNHPAGSSQFQFGNGSFTIEAWVYPRSFASTPIIISNLEWGTSTNYWVMYLNTSGFLVWGSNYNSVTVGITANLNPLQLNTWSHVAAVHNQSQNATYLYVNGVQSGALIDNVNYGVPAYLTSIGVDQDGDEARLDGYISNVRVVKNAVYTSNFTPPAAPLTAIANTVLLTCQDLNVVDNSTNNFNIIQFGTGVNTVTVTPFGTSLTTGMVRFNSSSSGIESYDGVRWQNITSGTGALQLPVGSTVDRTQTAGSVNFDGTGDALLVPADPAFEFGTGAFTIEAWVYARSFGNFPYIFACWETGGTQGYALYFNNSGGLRWSRYGYGSNLDEGATTNISGNSWQHIALVKSGSSIIFYINGVASGSVTDSANNYAYLPYANIGIAGDQNGDENNFNGYISNLRVVKGTAVYTANFTPVKEPLQAIANTVLLTCQGDTIRDTSVNDFPITVVGDAAPNVFGPIKLDEFISAKGMMRFNSDLNKFEGYDGLSWISINDSNAVSSTSTSTNYITFVDSNNTATRSESLYTTSSLSILPSTGDIYMNGTGAVQVPRGTTAQRPGSYFSIAFDGTNDYLTVDDNTLLDVEASEFTLETWIYPTSTTGARHVFAKRSANNVYGLTVGFGSGSLAPTLSVTVNGTSWGINTTAWNSFALNQWGHLALVRQSNTWILFVNGIASVYATLSGTVPNNTAAFAIGADAAAGTSKFIGKISNFRLVKGTAIYADNFIPFNQNLENVTNTSLLTAQSNAVVDNSSNAFTINKIGNPLISFESPFSYAASPGMLRFNSDNNFFEGYDGFTWGPLDRKTYSTLIGDAINTSYTITHNLMLDNIFFQCKEVATGAVVNPYVIYNSTSTATVSFALIPTTSQYKLSLLGF